MKYPVMIVTAILIMVSLGAAAEWEVFVNSNYVTTLLAGAGGVWWGGLYGGAVLYSPGTEHFQKTLKAVGELRSNQVSAIAVDQGGAVWIGTAHDGVCINDGGAWRFEGTQSLHLLGDDVFDIVARGARVAVGTSGGLSFFNDGDFVTFFNGNDWARSGCDSVLAVALNDDEAVVGTPCGAFAYDLGTSTWRQIVGERRSRRVAFDGDSLFWILAGDSIYAYNGLASRWVTRLGIGASTLYDIGVRGSRVWVATNGGPYRYRQSLVRWTQNVNGFPSQTTPGGKMTRIRLADDGIPWIGTQDGAGYLPDTAWVMVKSPGPASNYVEDLCEDGTGRLWFTTGYRKAGPPPGADRGIVGYNPATLEWKHLLYPEIASNRAFTCEASTIDSTVWFGYWDAAGGLVRYNPVTSTWTSYRDSLKARVIPDIYIDESGLVIFSQYLFGIGVRSPQGKFVHYSKDDQDSCLTSTCMTAVGAGPGGSYMFGNYFVSELEPCTAEIVRLDMGSDFSSKADDLCERWTPLNNYPQGIATYALALDPFGIEWIGSDGGLGSYDFTCRNSGRRNWYRTNVRLGSVWDVKVDSRGNKWVACDQGLYVLKGFGLEWSDFTDIEVFTSANSPLEDVPVKAIDFAADGAVWIGTGGGGIYRYDLPPVESRPKSWVDAYPNPYLPFKDACGKGIGFSGARPGSSIKIFTVSGELVNEVASDQTWDARNGNGDEVVSGVYIYVGRAQDGTDFKGRLVIIR